MAATVIINELNGAGETKTAKTDGTLRFKNADNATVDTNDPLVIPTSNTEYSREKWTRLEITGGTFTELSNLKWYTDGSNSYNTGIKLWVATDASYSTPAVVTETDDPPEHDGVDMEDAFGYTSGSPLSLGAGPYSSAADIGSYVVNVMEVEQSASTPGASGDETLTYAYDEI